MRYAYAPSHMVCLPAAPPPAAALRVRIRELRAQRRMTVVFVAATLVVWLSARMTLS